jgi:hypothetical protein
MSWSVIIRMKPATSAAAAGLGKPWKKRLSTTSMFVLKRARRKRGAGAVDEGGDPAQLAQAAQRPFVDHQRRRGAEGHHVRQRVVLGAELALGIGQAGDAAVQAVEKMAMLAMNMAAQQACSKMRWFIAITIGVESL